MDKPQRQRERRSRRNKEAETRDEVVEKETQTKRERYGPRLIQSVAMKIPSRFMGLLIGPRGVNIFALQQRTRCKVQISGGKGEDTATTTTQDNNNKYESNYDYDNYDDNNINNEASNNDNKDSKSRGKSTKDSEMREIILTGSPEEIDACEKELNFVVKNNRFMLDKERGTSYTKKSENEIAETMRVPSKVCGMLIGMEGKKISEIQFLTGAEIFVEFDDHQHVEAGVSTVTIKGHKHSVEMAKEEIRKILEMFGGAGGKGAQEYVFEIPSYCSKQLIGVKGNTIRQLQGTYGVTISIKKYQVQDPSLFRDDTIQKTDIVQLIGERENMKLAKQAIDELLGGAFIKCDQCHKLVLEKDGREDVSSSSYHHRHEKNRWYCNNCWAEWGRLHGINTTSNYNTEPNYYDEFKGNTTNWAENYSETDSHQRGEERARFANEESNATTYETQPYYMNNNDNNISTNTQRYQNPEKDGRDIRNNVQEESPWISKPNSYNPTQENYGASKSASSYDYGHSYYPPAPSSSSSTDPTSFEKKPFSHPGPLGERQFKNIDDQTLLHLASLSLNTQRTTNTTASSSTTMYNTATNNSNTSNTTNTNVYAYTHSQIPTQMVPLIPSSQRRDDPIPTQPSVPLRGRKPPISNRVNVNTNIYTQNTNTNIKTNINTTTNTNTNNTKLPKKPPRGRGNFQGF